MFQRIHFHFIRNFLRSGQCFRNIGKNRLHLFGRLQPFLFGVVHSVGVIELFARTQTNQAVVRLAVLLVHEVDVVGGDHLSVRLRGQAQNALVGHFLLLVNRAVATGFIGFMSLNFKIIVITKDTLEPHHGILGFFILTIGDVTRHLARKTCGGHNQTFVILLQQFTVDARTIVFAIDPRLGDDFTEIMVTRFVLGQQDQVVAATIFLVFFDKSAACGIGVGHPCHIRLASENGFEDFLFELVDFPLALSLFCFVCKFRQLFFQCLDFVLHLSVFLTHHIRKLFDAVHHAVVGDGHGIHAVGETLVHQCGDRGHAVQDRILGMHMKMRELAHSQWF